MLLPSSISITVHFFFVSTTVLIMPCPSCHSNPCVLEGHKESLIAELGTLDDSVTKSKRRNHLYRVFVSSEYGVLGAGRRVKIPDCVVLFIRSICHPPDGRYTGFRSAGYPGCVSCEQYNGNELANEDGVNNYNGYNHNVMRNLLLRP
jgi:hypothetical protein